MLKLYNALSREKELFTPIDPHNVRMYVCGPTVYDAAHIGNARPVIVFDLLFRLLRQLYGSSHVTYVRNITDVDDKINMRAFERGVSIRTLTDDTLQDFRHTVTMLGCLSPTHEPRATDFICNGSQPLDMVRLIQRLIARGHAYEADGHVLFHVPSMPAYGRLARRSADDMLAGARVEVAPYKRDPMDFVLWKPSLQPHEPGWDSPWGRGRPGWHIECSAMAGAYLGEIFDIHAGGIDLIFPHHENEIAQSCCAFGTDKMANYWLHNGFLQVEGQKMSKSLGNFITIRDVLADWPADVIRFNMFKTHYRQPIDWTLRSLEESRTVLEGWMSVLDVPAAEPEFPALSLEALCDDLNTPKMLAALHQAFRNTPESVAQTLAALGFSGVTIQAQSGLDTAAIEELMQERTSARAARNWAESDRLREALRQLGVEPEDHKDGTSSWKRITS